MGTEKCKEKNRGKDANNSLANPTRRIITPGGTHAPQIARSKEMGVAEIEQFLTDLAVNEHVAASTQTQALCAILFLYKQVLYQFLH